MKSHKFVTGLRPEVRFKVEPLRLRAYLVVVEVACVIEVGHKRGEQLSLTRPLQGGAEREGGFKKPRFDRGAGYNQKSQSMVLVTSVKPLVSQRPVNYPEGCTCCGKPGHLKRECNMRHFTCRTCGKEGHLSNVCFQKNRARGGGIQSNQSDAHYRAPFSQGQGGVNLEQNQRRPEK